MNFALNHFTSNVSHTYNSFSVGTVSNIDHFIVTDSIFQCISSYYTCDEIDNQSNHLPLFVTIDIEVKCADPVINPTSNVRLPREQWDRASIIEFTQYKPYLDDLLLLLDIPMDCVNCTDYFCTDYSHIVGIQNLIIASCIEASKVIPVSKKSTKIPGWNEHVERHKQISQFWHFI